MLTAHRPRVCVCACVCAWLAASRESGIGLAGGTELFICHTYIHLAPAGGYGWNGGGQALHTEWVEEAGRERVGDGRKV
jgi:hypothetical protein